ncbi:EAL domain-containing protein, partial [Solemya elarraichensis gill symbiont]
WNEILGYAENEFTPTGATVFKAIHPDDVRYVKKGVLEHVRKGGESPYKREFRMQTRDGNWKWGTARGKVLERDANGSPIRMIGTLTDITERKQSEMDLLSSKELLQSIIERAPIRVFWKDRDLRFLGCNELFAKDAGLTHPDQLIGKTDYEMGWKEQAELYRADDLKVIETGLSKLDFEEPQTTPEGHIIWVRTSKVPLLNPTTDEIIGVLGLYEDITERKQAENELRLSKEQLSEAQRITKTGSWTLDLANNHLDWSDEVYRIFEIDKTQFNSSYEAFLDAAHPDDREMVNQAYLDSLNSHTQYEMTHRILVGDGRIKYVHETCETLFDKDGKALRSRGTVQDVTEQKQAEEELRIAATAFESQQGIMVTDAGGKILQVNSAFMEMSGYKADEIIGNTPRMFQSGRHDSAFYEEMWKCINSDSFWQGEIWDKRKSGEVYPKLLTISAVTDADGQVSHYVGAHADITEKKSAEEKIDHLAYYDQLTGLPNKIQLMNILEQTLAACVRDNQYSAVLMIDLDHFNKLNNTLGHVVGDELLVQVARSLEDSTSSLDTVARFGGDKFVVILPELAADKTKAARTAEKVTRNILQALNKEYKLGVASHHSTVSIGVNLFSSETLTIDVLLKQAELAMYESKSAGRNTMSCYDPKMQSSVSKLVTMEKELRSALDNEEFFLHYQPQASLQNGRIIGVEALIRWNSPKLGLVPPVEFIPVLEEMELIVDVGNWVLEESCECLKKWHQSGFDHIRIGINVSPAQFKSKNFLDTVKDILKKTKVPPDCVELEITEGVVMNDPLYAKSLLNDLHKLGLKIAIDDFGTGYSSLSNLMDLPFDTLKIDRAFVKGLPDNADSVSFCNTILALAKALKLHTIAEGVEEVSQLRFLNRIDCTIIQGFYFSNPLPPQEVEKMLSDGVCLSVADRRSDFALHEA